MPNFKQAFNITYSQDREKKVFSFVAKIAKVNTSNQFTSHIKHHYDGPPNPGGHARS